MTKIWLQKPSYDFLYFWEIDAIIFLKKNRLKAI